MLFLFILPSVISTQPAQDPNIKCLYKQTSPDDGDIIAKEIMKYMQDHKYDRDMNGICELADNPNECHNCVQEILDMRASAERSELISHIIIYIIIIPYYILIL